MQQATSSSLEIRPVAAEDAGHLCDIYNYYVRTSTITFEEQPVTSTQMAGRIREVQSIPLPWLVATDAEQMMGFAYANKWRTRAAYRYSTEITVYIREGFGQRGIGAQLYGELLAALKASNVHAVIGGVALPNDASLRLHRKFGFEQVAHFKEVGFKFDRWIDVTYWQRVL